MRPAFSDVRYAAAFAALLLALLAAPAVVSSISVLDRSTVYSTMPTGTGPASHIQRQIFEETDDLDIVFIGSSLMWSAIDAPYVQSALTAQLGRQAAVTVIASVWPGLDRDYAYLRDLLMRRRVGLAVIQFPNRNRPTRDAAAEVNRVSDQPHVQSYRFYRVGEFPRVDEAVDLRYRVALYAEAVLGLPRHALAMLRPDYVTPAAVEVTLGARLQPFGFYGAPYEIFRPTPPDFRPEEMTYSEDAASRYRFFDEPLPPYQQQFARLIAALLGEYGVPAVLLHIPQANEIDAEFVEERENWLESTGIDAEMIGIPPANLFERFSRADTVKFFSSDHLNDNGAIYFTRAVTPALLRVYSRNEETD